MTRPPNPAPDRLFTRAFMAVFAAALVFFVSGGIVIPIAPRFATGPIGADAIGFGVAMGIFSLASLAVRPLVGWSSDRFGRRPLLVGGSLLTVVALLLHLPATGLPLFIAARALLGVGEACFLVAGLAAGGDLAPPRRTGEALSLLSLSIYGGVAVGPVIGETLLGAGGYPAVWVGAGLLALVAAGLAWLAPETRPTSDDTGKAPRGRLFHPGGVFPGFLMLCGTFGMAGFLTFVPLYAVELGLDGAGAALAVFGVVVIVLRAFGAKLPDRLGPVRLGATALTCTAVGLTLIGVLPGQAGLLVGTAVFAAGVALTLPAVMTLAMSRASADERGSVVGTTSVFLDLSFGLAPVVLAPLAASAGYAATFLAAGVLAAVGAIVLVARRAAVMPAPQPAG
jgi:predicted MFS family arabinose efflux permease